MTEISKLLDILTTGSPEEYRKAKKDLWKLWNTTNGRLPVENSANEVFAYIEKFDDIKDINNKKAFIAGLSLFFLVLSDEYFDELKIFTLKVIQNPDGHIREAIRKTSDWLFVSLSSRMDPFIYPKSNPLTEKQKYERAEARKQFRVYLSEVENLLEKYRLPENEDSKYIENMKPSVEKSLQMLWSRLSDLSRDTVESSPEILKRRKEIEQELSHLVNKYNSKSSMSEIKQIVYEEDGQEDYNEIITLFKDVENLSELNKILKTLNDVWNYFPHRSLMGLSPAEKKMESLN